MEESESTKKGEETFELIKQQLFGDKKIKSQLWHKDTTRQIFLDMFKKNSSISVALHQTLNQLFTSTTDTKLLVAVAPYLGKPFIYKAQHAETFINYIRDNKGEWTEDDVSKWGIKIFYFINHISATHRRC